MKFYLTFVIFIVYCFLAVRTRYELYVFFCIHLAALVIGLMCQRYEKAAALSRKVLPEMHDISDETLRQIALISAPALEQKS